MDNLPGSQPSPEDAQTPPHGVSLDGFQAKAVVAWHRVATALSTTVDLDGRSR